VVGEGQGERAQDGHRWPLSSCDQLATMRRLTYRGELAVGKDFIHVEFGLPNP
jgi:hypothetical protein